MLRHSYICLPPSHAILLFTALIVSACEQGNPPTESHIYAAAGIFGGALNVDGSRAIVGSIYHGGSLWDNQHHERLFNWNHKSGEQTQITSATFSADAQFAATADPQTMVLWDAVDGSAVSFWNSPSEIHAINLLPQGNYAVLALENFSAALFNSRQGGVQRTYRHDNRVNSVSTSSSKDILLTGSDDTTAKLWRLSSGELLHQWNHENEVQLVKLSPDGSLALTVSQYDKASIWSTETGEKVADVPFRTTALARGVSITAAIFSNDNQHLAIGLTNQTIKLLQLNSMTTVSVWLAPKRIKGQPSRAISIDLAFTSENTLIALMSDGLLHHFPLATQASTTSNEPPR